MRKQSSVKVPTPEIQGEGSYITFKTLNYGDRKAIRNEVRGLEREELNVYMYNFALSRVTDWNWTDENDKPIQLPKVERYKRRSKYRIVNWFYGLFNRSTALDDAYLNGFTDEEVGVLLMTGFKALQGTLTWTEEDAKNSDGV